MEGSPYRKFSFSRGKGTVLGTGPGTLRSGDLGCLLARTQRPVSCLGSREIQYLSIFFPNSDHGHKTDDCVALRIEVNKLLKKGNLREFLSEKAQSHLCKGTTGKPTEAAPASPPRQNRVIHVISGSSEISGLSHAAAKKSTWNTKHGLEAAKPKCLRLGTDEISFNGQGANHAS